MGRNYKFLFDPTNSQDLFMQNNDYLYVPPAERIVEVEALRYNYILDLDTQEKNNNSKEILILGDYSKSITEELLEIVYQTFKE